MKERERTLLLYGDANGRIRGWCRSCLAYELDLDDDNHVVCSACGAHDLISSQDKP